ncbi:MAG: hypothetical protein ABI702_23500 [Burkholderiales bacterium]
MITREPIYAALFAKLSAAAKFKTVDRVLRHWVDVTASEQPALFQSQRFEDAATIPGQPTVWMLRLDIYLYAHTGGDKKVSPGALLNPLIDAVEAALAPDVVTGKCRLGGLVEHAWIEGSIDTDEGTLGDQAVAIVPIVIKAV